MNNAVARAAGLLAVAVLPVAAGITGSAYGDPEALTDGFRVAVLITAVLAGSGGVLAAFTIDDDVLDDDDEGSIPPRHCAVDGPPASTRSARAPVV